MGFRYRKSVKIMPGVRLNFSKSGVSTSLGGRGATVNIGKKGVRTTVGIPGTGLSHTSFKPHAKVKPAPAPTQPRAQPLADLRHQPTPPREPMSMGRSLAMAIGVLVAILFAVMILGALFGR